jgi:hypothetical protein
VKNLDFGNTVGAIASLHTADAVQARSLTKPIFCAATEINVVDLARDNHIIILFSCSVPNSCSDSKRFVIAVSALWVERFVLFV